MKSMWTKKAFSLVEIMVVIVAIAILGSMAFPKIKYAIELSRAEEGVNFLRMTSAQMQDYKIEHGNYTGSKGDLDVFATQGGPNYDLKYFFITKIGGTTGMGVDNFGLVKIWRNNKLYQLYMLTSSNNIYCINEKPSVAGICAAIRRKFN